MIDRIMSSRKNCDCDISQLVVKLFTKLLGILDHDCRSQTYSRKYLPRRSGNGKKRKSGGAGSRHRRFEARHAGTARRTSTSSPVPDRAIPPAWAPPSVPGRAPPDRPKPTASIPPPPPRSASLIFQEEQAKLIAKLGSKLQEKLIPKKPCELCPLVCMCMDVDLNRKAVKQGQTARQCSLNPKQDVGLRRSTRQHTLDSSQTTLQPKDQMLKQATRFLDKASEQMCRDAENKQKWEKVRNTPGRGFQKNQSIPNNVPFCLLCLAYKNKIHYCSAVNKYINLDERSLVMIEGVNAEEVEGRFSNTGTCRIFETKKEMRTYLCNRVKKEQEAKKTMVDSNSLHLNFEGQGLQLFTKHVKVHKDDLEYWGKERAIELARERHARLAKAQLEKEELEKEKEKANIQKSAFSKAELAEAYLELKGVPPHLAILN